MEWCDWWEAKQLLQQQQHRVRQPARHSFAPPCLRAALAGRLVCAAAAAEAAWRRSRRRGRTSPGGDRGRRRCRLEVAIARGPAARWYYRSGGQGPASPLLPPAPGVPWPRACKVRRGYARERARPGLLTRTPSVLRPRRYSHRGKPPARPLRRHRGGPSAARCAWGHRCRTVGLGGQKRRRSAVEPPPPSRRDCGPPSRPASLEGEAGSLESATPRDRSRMGVRRCLTGPRPRLRRGPTGLPSEVASRAAP
jgi:hypothetical protein